MARYDAAQSIIGSKYVIDDKTGCWNWRGEKNYKGYGITRIKGKFWFAHRLSYTLFIGEIEGGMMICHRCDNKSCVNPDHLYAGTAKDNSDDMHARGGYKHPGSNMTKSSKLTWNDVVDIRNYDKTAENKKMLAVKYSVSAGLIGRVMNGVIWKTYHPSTPWGGRIKEEYIPRRIPVIDRLISKIKKLDNGCWEWIGAKNQNGYGVIRIKSDNGAKRSTLAHRIVYEETVGAIPDKMYLLHSCDNPSCVNVEHLRIGTPEDNTRDIMERGRHADMSGENAPSAKLTLDQVNYISKSPDRIIDLAREFSVDRHTISSIKHNRTWRKARGII